MKKFDLRPTGAPYSEAPAFREATAEELRVLLVFLELRTAATDEEIAALAGVSAARVSSAATLWTEAGILAPADRAPADNTVTDVYASHIDGSTLMEESGEAIAEVIRRKKLAELFTELAKMMEKPMLSAAEIRRLSSLVSQYGVSPEYVSTLAAHIAEKGKLSVTSLVNRAIRLASDGVTEEAELEEYLRMREQDREDLYEIRRIFGIYDRALSKTEEETFLRWTRKYLFSAEIIGEAYDITAVSTNSASLPYADAILKKWYEKGCKTLDDVRALQQKEAAERDAQKEKDAKERPARAKKEPKARYGDFDPEEALKAALARSFEEKK